MRILIIEDEIKTAKQLASIITEIDDTIFVIDNIVSIEHAVQWLKSNSHPNLIISDIQLADGLSFEIFKQVQLQSPIIFCTAYDEYMLEAFETNAISYLLKPITKNKVEKALEKFNNLKSTFQEDINQINISNLINSLKKPLKTTLLLNQKEKIIPVQVSDIAYIYLDKTLVEITTKENQHFYHTSTLDEMEKILDSRVFYRANRQFLINRNFIVSIERYFARKLVIKTIFKTKETIFVSKAKASDFLKWLEGK